MVERKEWLEAQQWEKEWHDDCINSFNEELKQFTYAGFMGLNPMLQNYYGQKFWDMGNKTILDVGCGPYSMLLKVKTTGAKFGIDPIKYPDWVLHRYNAANITFINEPAEELGINIPYDVSSKFHSSEIDITGGFVSFKGDTSEIDFTQGLIDEAWIYNCLQHVIDPEKIIANVRKCAKVIRIFEWVEQGISPGHLHDLHAKDLDKWLGGKGKEGVVAERGCFGTCYYGIFKGEHYGK